jgi:DNA mismatch repair protein MutL
MAQVHRLPDHLVNKIAAGEVVERPAAAVKELVENSLDAGARMMTVDLRDGGVAWIRIGDDGCGMTPGDLELALERHATSKISSEADLGAVATLGFRGEALPAICSVSRFVITTRAAEHADGIRVRGEGGAVLERGLVPAALGTTVEVGDLFFNTPARLKFLKSPSTELAATLRLVTALALAHPGVHLRVTNNGKAALSAPAATAFRDRIGALLGYERAARLLPVERTEHSVRIAGFVSPPTLSRGARDEVVIIVNGRPVRDTLLVQAVLDAFRPLLPRDRFPVAVITIALPPADVDVNVHPTKAWVRFRAPRLVQEMVLAAIQTALRQPGVVGAVGPVSPGSGGLAADAGAGHHVSPAGQADLLTFAGDGSVGASTGEIRSAGRQADPGGGGLVGEPIAPYAAPLFGRVLGQVQETFIVATSDAEVFFIDQHVAHERVLFERLHAELARGPLASQEMLIAESIDLSPAARALLARWQPALERLGFAIDETGPGVALRAVPALLHGQEPRRLLERLLDDLRPASGAPIEIDRVLAFVACRAAIKANEPMAREAMERLVADLSRSGTPYFCPHGRPIVSRVSLSEVRKELKRTW